MGTNKFLGSNDCNQAEDAGVVCPLSTEYVHVVCLTYEVLGDLKISLFTMSDTKPFSVI